jgi:HK97 family phage major capsid protein
VQLDQGAGTLVGFGDIRAGFVIRRVRNIEVVVDPYNSTATRQTAYHAWMRTDSAVQDSAAYSVSDYTNVAADAVD